MQTMRLCLFNLFLSSCLLLISPMVQAQESDAGDSTPELSASHKWQLNPPERKWRVRLNPELGFVGPVFHTIQLSQDGTKFDYLEEGGQDNLFLYARLQAEFEFFERLNIVFLYQPLDIRTKVALQNDHRFNGTDYPAGTPLDLRYGFSFYRLSIYYDFFRQPDRELGIGLSAQIRNATIDFTSADGTKRTSTRDIGFVPIIKLRGRYTFAKGFFLATEIDGFYAQGKGVVGRTNVEAGFKGLIVDASVRAGFYAAPVGDIYLNIRYIGGGAEGTSESSPPPSDGYTSNWLHTIALSLGFILR